ncbi:HET-domain-containing protein [Paraphaeosphaeria sporulosa]|uniref:HET-domain-containing protein n=1 Tax=Paraphaeosphaeria sporulosa TaxID=1460663 RepID=A0A177C1E0_9PLEO|nr:HET-domain-containing protein [Paraphaeosphaeria sporulosa]OAG00699.1 HET-domain-containing protein [Paraphaeosphaeria sporulosa]
MWLLDTETITLSQQPDDDDDVEYAILSHRWGNDDEEVSFSDIQNPDVVCRKLGYEKIRKCCAQARNHGFKYAWVDTCCIDKSSSAELQEAINSMYRWYERAKVCYAYLQDVPSVEVSQSEWFTRGWTLQELLAPRIVLFFDQSWNYLGDQDDLLKSIHKATKIRHDVLQKRTNIHVCCIAERMSWAAMRRTKRIEDRAYSLFGIFQVHLPMLYGEREAAFQRLQREILKTSEDDTLFAWTGVSRRYGGLLAPNLEAFRHGALLDTSPDKPSLELSGLDATERSIGITAPLIPWSNNLYLMLLGCIRGNRKRSFGNKGVGIYLRALDGENNFARVRLSGEDLAYLNDQESSSTLQSLAKQELLTPYRRNPRRTWMVNRTISIRQLPLLSKHQHWLDEWIYGFCVEIPAAKFLPYPVTLSKYTPLVSSLNNPPETSHTKWDAEDQIMWAVHGAFYNRGIIGALEYPRDPGTGEKLSAIRDIHFGFDHLFNPTLYIRKGPGFPAKYNIDSFFAWIDKGRDHPIELHGGANGSEEADFWNEIRNNEVVDRVDRDFWAIKGDRKARIQTYRLPIPRRDLHIVLRMYHVWNLSLVEEKLIATAD